MPRIHDSSISVFDFIVTAHITGSSVPAVNPSVVKRISVVVLCMPSADPSVGMTKSSPPTALLPFWLVLQPHSPTNNKYWGLISSYLIGRPNILMLKLFSVILFCPWNRSFVPQHSVQCLQTLSINKHSYTCQQSCHRQPIVDGFGPANTLTSCIWCPLYANS